MPWDLLISVAVSFALLAAMALLQIVTLFFRDFYQEQTEAQVHTGGHGHGAIPEAHDSLRSATAK